MVNVMSETGHAPRKKDSGGGNVFKNPLPSTTQTPPPRGGTVKEEKR
jgi:hypothetical protein